MKVTEMNGSIEWKQKANKMPARKTSKVWEYFDVQDSDHHATRYWGVTIQLVRCRAIHYRHMDIKLEGELIFSSM